MQTASLVLGIPIGGRYCVFKLFSLIMAFEIEHKYLVINDSYFEFEKSSVEIAQGYLSREVARTVRVRIKGDKGYLTVKGVTEVDTRLEFEYEIPVNDARQLLDMCEEPVIRKIRHFVEFEGHLWEVDEFLDSLAPLILAEVELSRSDETYQLPPFVGENVTGNPAYFNSNLVKFKR